MRNHRDWCNHLASNLSIYPLDEGWLLEIRIISKIIYILIKVNKLFLNYK